MMAQLIRRLERLTQAQAVGRHRRRRLGVILAGHTVIGHDNWGVLIALAQQQIYAHHPLRGGEDRVGDVRIPGS